MLKQAPIALSWCKYQNQHSFLPQYVKCSIDTSGLKAIFDYINGRRVLRFLILLNVLFLCWNLFLQIKYNPQNPQKINLNISDWLRIWNENSTHVQIQPEDMIFCADQYKCGLWGYKFPNFWGSTWFISLCSSTYTSSKSMASNAFSSSSVSSLLLRSRTWALPLKTAATSSSSGVRGWMIIYYIQLNAI